MLFVSFVIFNIVSFYFIIKRAKKQSGAFAEQFNANFNNAQQAQTDHEGQAVKCEACGSYVASELSIRRQIKGRETYFCSNECENGFANEG